MDGVGGVGTEGRLQLSQPTAKFADTAGVEEFSEYGTPIRLVGSGGQQGGLPEGPPQAVCLPQAEVCDSEALEHLHVQFPESLADVVALAWMSGE